MNVSVRGLGALLGIALLQEIHEIRNLRGDARSNQLDAAG
jgi:hypothetical protein